MRARRDRSLRQVFQGQRLQSICQICQICRRLPPPVLAPSLLFTVAAPHPLPPFPAPPSPPPPLRPPPLAPPLSPLVFLLPYPIPVAPPSSPRNRKRPCLVLATRGHEGRRSQERWIDADATAAHPVERIEDGIGWLLWIPSSEGKGKEEGERASQAAAMVLADPPAPSSDLGLRVLLLCGRDGTGCLLRAHAMACLGHRPPTCSNPNPSVSAAGQGAAHLLEKLITDLHADG
nr:uncharacterized protein LOC120968967 [Aegilops tauschii subsp. strangulata]